MTDVQRATSISPETRAELLAAADRDELVAIAEGCTADLGDPTVLLAPETGLVLLQVREPVCEERFHLGEVVVTRCEVDLDGRRGWSMRLGTDRVAALAGAICDAAANGPSAWADRIAELCDRTQRAIADADAREWAELAATQVRFEELDR